MRPLPGDEAFGRPRAAANSDNEPSTVLPSAAAPQMTFFLADESRADASPVPAAPAHPRHKETRRAPSPGHPDKITRDAGGRAGLRGRDDALLHDDLEHSRDESPAFRPSATPSLSQPMTPVFLGGSGPASALSSVSSRRNSFSGSLSEDLSTHNQAFSVSGDTDREPSSSMMDSGSAPQLVMPSIKMPSRRPFTEEGKHLGRLKVLVAGAAGVGKTSLIKAIVQSCEHIVHVDPIGPSPNRSLVLRSAAKSKGKKNATRAEAGTAQITEIYASTKPYPEWWSDLEESRVLKRRKSLGDTVLDRNICFVDTPGYGNGASSSEVMNSVVHYVESHLQRVSSNTVNDGDLLNMLGGDGGGQVDVVFYIISNDFSAADAQYLRQLAPLTNIVPLVAQADLLSPDRINEIKEQIASELQQSNIRPFSFVASSAASESSISSAFAVSSATGSDHEIMDASLLMSPDYVQPLIPTELSTLVQKVFSQNGTSWLRYSAARKHIQWRRAENSSRPMALYRPLSLDSGYANMSLSQVLTPSGGAPSTFALARVADHTQREEKLAQIRLANWAADLQRSLANERARYENLARGERAVWLTERLNECVQDGTLVPRSMMREPKRREKMRRKMAADRSLSGQPDHDPLGLLEVAAKLRRRGWVALEVLGSLGVLGGLALWLAKYQSMQPYGWLAEEWTKFWYGERV